MHHGTARLEAHEHYQKRTWRNRTAIQSSQDPLVLTVPLRKGKHQQQPIREVLIAFHEPWVKHHVQSIQSVYGKTAYAGEVIPGIEAVLKDCPPTLFELNRLLLEYVASLLPIPLPYSLTTAYETSLPTDPSDFREGIPAGVSSTGSIPIPVYDQVQRLQKSFQANLSILDVLCHLGPDTPDYLSRYKAALYPSL